MRQIVALFLSVLLIGFSRADAQQIPAAIYTDPPADAAHPASMDALQIPSNGEFINAVIYSPPGPGPHPTLVLCHGLPGIEKNLDLAQAVRRAGWNAVTFNYRGSWGSQGVFRLDHGPGDAQAVIDYLRDPKNAAALRVNPKRIAIAGHSFGGWVAALTLARDRGLLGAALISPVDMGGGAPIPHAKLVELLSGNTIGLSGVSPEILADEISLHADDFRLAKYAKGLAARPLLVLTSDDGFAEGMAPMIQGIRDDGGKLLVVNHIATDHVWSDHRIGLQTLIINWLAGLP
jgi:pimeloyl-ACP methyl ester carboxylesterase